MNVSFNNTENAFEYKSDKELKQSKFIFGSMGYPLVVPMGTRLTPFLMRTRLPIHGIIRRTIFKQFVGGESLEETQPAVEMLRKFNVQVILDYGVEGKQSEEDYDLAAEQFIKNIEYAATQPNIPFISVKITGLARFGLLQKLNDAPRLRSGIHDYEDDMIEWQKVKDRMVKICTVAAEKNIGVLIDAEESWIQDPIDRLAMELMGTFNTEKVIVYNTMQLYRTDRLRFLRLSYSLTKGKGFKLGMKLVRGAYMEKERERALLRIYPSPIHVTKEETDRDFNEAIKYCIDNIEDISMVIASHNEESNLLALQLLEEKQLPFNHPHIHFSQLYGMSDNVTFNLAKAGCNASKYLPFGPIKEVIPYLMRRAEENTSINGQTPRELSLIKKELKRRKNIEIKK
jgi:Proline dehydrogenase